MSSTFDTIDALQSIIQKLSKELETEDDVNARVKIYNLISQIELKIRKLYEKIGHLY